jgi:hypothetical protein
MSICTSKSNKSAFNDDDEDLIIDSISSDYYDGFLSDFRTNSSSSIKWSTNARKHNEEDWLSIERILYGEEELPDGKRSQIIHDLCLLSIFFPFILHFHV